jgi:chromate transporter
VSAALSIADWLTLFGQFMVLSMLSIGGAIVLVPDMQRLMVEQYGLLSVDQFNASIAIAQASPGPNVLFVAVLGYQAAGPVGAAATLLGIMLPSSVLALAVSRWGAGREPGPAARAFKAGFAPVTIALLICSAWVLVAQTPGWRAMLLAAGAALLMWRTRIHLLWLIGAGAAAGILGWV